MGARGRGTSAGAILIVDDNAALADNLREILEDAGYQVELAASCAAARQRAGAFHVALVDVRLPDGDGTALAAELKAGSVDSEVIVLTGFAALESAVSAVRAGAWAYLVKPVATDDLLVTVRQAARQVRLVEEKRFLARRAQVAEKLAAVGTLAAGLSHEIRNPLNAASLQLTVLARRVGKLPPEARPSLLEPLDLVQSEIRRLNQVLEDFLTFARPRELVPMPVDLASVVGGVLDLLDEQAASAGVRLERRLGAARRVAGDAHRLKQALLNLVLNSIQATPPGGWVRVELDDDAPDVVLAVEDSGPGIPPELRSRIFEPFFTTKEAGTGLGLPLVHSIVQQHGGSIQLDEKSAGGARFVMRLLPSLA